MNDNLKLQLAEYRNEVRDLWMKTIPAIALICVIVIFGMTWGLVQLTGVQPLGADWHIVAACLSIAFMVPPIKMLHPERPTEESVAHDKVLSALGRQLSSKR